jgi:hypothetical protein
MLFSILYFCTLGSHMTLYFISFFPNILRGTSSTTPTAPLRRRIRFVRHEKGWMRRKRLKMERRYLRLQEGVEELKAYIKFKQEYRR